MVPSEDAPVQRFRFDKTFGMNSKQVSYFFEWAVRIFGWDIVRADLRTCICMHTRLGSVACDSMKQFEV